MTYGKNIVSICQENTGTDETKENVNLSFSSLEKIQSDFFRKRSHRVFQTLQS